MNSPVVKLLLDMLSKFLLNLLSFVLPAVHQLFKLIPNKAIVEDRELRTWKEHKVSNFSHADHVVEQVLLLEH